MEMVCLHKTAFDKKMKKNSFIYKSVDSVFV